MFSDIHNGNIRRRIILTGGVLIVLPFLLLSLAGWMFMRRFNQTLMVSEAKTSTAHLSTLTRNLADICRNAQQAGIDTLNSGRALLAALGTISFSREHRLQWLAKNEATGEITKVPLPVMSAGGTPFLPIEDFAHPAPVVDEIEKINGTPATIFQRINERGDMLRICTSVKSATGTRDIGSYIPMASSGQDSEALADVLAGKSNVAKTIFSHTTYLTAYQPLADQAGRVVGMLSTALPEAQITAKIRSLLDRQSNVDRVGLFAWHANGPNHGTALIMADKSLEGQDLWNRKDASGKLYVQQICSRAMVLPSGEVAEYKYQQQPRVGAIPQTIVAKFAHVPEMDWVVGYAQPEADFLAGAAALQSLLNWGMWLLMGIGLAGTGLAVRIWIQVSDDLAGKLSALLTNLTENAKQVSVAAERCRLATHETQSEVEQSRIQAENLIRLAEGLDRTVERINEYLELDR